MHHVSAKFVLRILTADQKQEASTSALDYVSSPPMMKPSCEGSSPVMRGGFTVTTLRQSNNHPCGKPHVTTIKEARQVKSNVKSTIATFSNAKGIVHKEIVPTGQNVNSGFYCEVLRRLRENVRRGRPQTLARTDLDASA